MKWTCLLLASAMTLFGQQEIPIPRIQTSLGTLPGVSQLPVRPELPDVLVMNDGTRVKTRQQWAKRREEMKRILEYYAVGQMPPAPGNVKGEEVQTEVVLDGTVRYRLVRLSFGPDRKLTLNIGVFTPVKGGPFPTIILQGGTPPGAAPLLRFPNGPNQGKGENVLMVVGPKSALDNPALPTGPFAAQQTAEATAKRLADVFRRGYALVVFNPNDCAEDTTLRNLDGSWAFRNTRFYPAYPGYDWGILAGWAWGSSRVADYLETDRSIDKGKLIITGASRNGKAAMVAAAFDDRLMGAPVVTGGGGVGAYRFAGPRKSETLDMMELKYPNWFSPNVREFRGNKEKLPFDQHWFLALAAPRPFIALEGDSDTISLPEAVKHSVLGAKPAYALLGAADRVGVNYAKHGHAFTPDDWTAMMDFFDLHLMGKKTDRRFDQYPTEAELDAALVRAKAMTALRTNVKGEQYLKHAEAVETITRGLAGSGDNRDEWGLAGLLHDIDINTTSADLSRHGIVGAGIIRDLGFPAAVVHAVQAHDDRAGEPRTSRLDHAVYCADQVYWLINKGRTDIPTALRGECEATGLGMDRVMEVARAAIAGK